MVRSVSLFIIVKEEDPGMPSHKKKRSEDFSHRPFKQLDEIVRAHGIDLSARERRIPREKDKKDDELFREAMSRVREIEEFTKMKIERKGPVKVKRKKERDTRDVLEDIAKGIEPIRISDTQEYISWMNPAYKTNLTDMLHRGDIAVQDFIDLHGCTVAEAEQEVNHFLKRAIQQGLCCVKIIHGRGLRSLKGPVLKEALINWLSRGFRRQVVAFTSARQCDGGLGALYVLLRCKVK